MSYVFVEFCFYFWYVYICLCREGVKEIKTGFLLLFGGSCWLVDSLILFCLLFIHMEGDG